MHPESPLDLKDIYKLPGPTVPSDSMRGSTLLWYHTVTKTWPTSTQVGVHVGRISWSHIQDSIALAQEPAAKNNIALYDRYNFIPGSQIIAMAKVPTNWTWDMDCFLPLILGILLQFLSSLSAHCMILVHTLLTAKTPTLPCLKGKLIKVTTNCAILNINENY